MLHSTYQSISYAGYLLPSEFAKLYCCMEMVLGHSSTEAAAALQVLWAVPTCFLSSTRHRSEAEVLTVSWTSMDRSLSSRLQLSMLWTHLLYNNKALSSSPSYKRKAAAFFIKPCFCYTLGLNISSLNFRVSPIAPKDIGQRLVPSFQICSLPSFPCTTSTKKNNSKEHKC